ATVMTFVRQGVWPLVLLLFMFNNKGYRDLEYVLLFWSIGSAACVAMSLMPLRSLSWVGWMRINWKWVQTGIMIAIPLLFATLSLRALFTADRYIFDFINGKQLLGVYTLYSGISLSLLTFVNSSVFVFIYPKL